MAYDKVTTYQEGAGDLDASHLPTADPEGI